MSPKSYGVYRIFKKRDNTMGFFKKDPLKKGKDLVDEANKLDNQDPYKIELLDEAKTYFITKMPQYPETSKEQLQVIGNMYRETKNYREAFKIFNGTTCHESALNTLYVWAEKGHPTEKIITSVLDDEHYSTNEINKIAKIFIEKNRYDVAIMCCGHTNNMDCLGEIQKKALESGKTRWALDIAENYKIPISFESGKKAAMNLINDPGDFKGARKLAKLVGSDELFDSVMAASKQKIDDTLETIHKNPDMNQTAIRYMNTIIGMYPDIERAYIHNIMDNVLELDMYFEKFDITNILTTSALTTDDCDLLENAVRYAIEKPHMGSMVFTDMRTGTRQQDVESLIPQIENISDKSNKGELDIGSVEEKFKTSKELFWDLFNNYATGHPSEISVNSESINGIAGAIKDFGKKHPDKEEHFYAMLRETVNTIYAERLN
ncbi:MAG: hypothetical protein KAJ91_00360 [Candidatus Aenigmarchaeota archaeon]|nr:hypothetical protein [Candidatus Aenigmarchaeota archaeon]